MQSAGPRRRRTISRWALAAASALLTVGGVLVNPAPAAAAQLESPASASATAGRRLIVVTWTAPTAPSTPVARYRATAGTESCDLVLPGSLTCTIGGLNANTAYTVGVVACPNASLADNTDCSNPTYATPVTPGPPGTPAAPAVAFQGDPNTVRLTWTPPDPGAGIASYKITPTPTTGLTGTCGVLVAGTTCDFAGLADDTSYTFKVTAIGITNSAGTTGTSTASAASAAKVAGLPHKPAKPDVARYSDTEVTVSWTKPAGNQALSGYTIRGVSSNGGAVPTPCTAGPDDTDCVLTGLDTAKTYTFTVEAKGEAPDGGTSPVSDASDSIIPGIPATPSTPTVELGAEAGDVTVYWEAPTEGGTVSGYTVTADPLDGGTPLADCLAAGTATHCDFTGLQNGKSYRFKVTATNTAGAVESAWSDAVVSELPDKPATPVATLGDAPGKISLSWNAPTGGGPVIYYAVTANPATGAQTGTNSPGCGFDLTTPTCEITGLDPAVSYTFTVTAVGDLGTVPSDPSASVVPNKPGAPTTVAVVQGDAPTKAIVTWAAPAGGSGGEVAGYTVSVTRSDSGAAPADCTKTPSDPFSCEFLGLDVTKSYTFTVRATNLSGGTDAVAVPSAGEIPSAPNTVTAVVGDAAGKAVVDWAAPNDAVQSLYTVTAASSDGGTIPTACTVAGAGPETCTFTGLTASKHYTFTVRAQNPLGGTAAAATTAMVPDEPGAATAPAVTVTSSGEVTVTWSAPATGGAVDTYTVTADSPDLGALPPESPCTVDMVANPSATLSCDFTAMATDKSYEFTVNASNDAGDTDATPTTAVVPGAPGAPGNVQAVLGDAAGKVTVTWDAPAGVSVTQYTVTPASGTPGAVIPAVCTRTVSQTRSCEFTTLTPTASYTFTARAENAVGGLDASPTAALTPDKPGVPTAVNVTLTASTPGAVTVVWGVPAGGGAPAGYTVTPVSATAGAVIPAVCTRTSVQTRSCAFTGLTTSATYTFEVRANNTAGTTDPTTSSSIVPNVPGAATGVTVTLGATPGDATVTWDAPTGAPVDDYTVSAASTAGGATIPTPCTRTAVQTRSCPFTNLTTSAPYIFTVQASNDAGDTDATSAAIVPNLPGAPTGVTVTLGDTPGEATVSWTEPTNLGPALTYTVTAGSVTPGANVPGVCSKTAADPRSCEYTTLTPTASYTFTVRAINPSGGTNAATTAGVIPDEPGVPTSVAAVQGDAPGKATVSWVAPTDKGVADSYTVTATPVGGGAATTCTKTSSDPTSCAFTGLDTTAEYSFTVQAVNPSGDAETAAAETFIPDKPSQPTGVTVTLDAIPGRVTVTWDPPTGAVVTDWTVTADSPDGGTVPSDCTRTAVQTRSCAFTGLTTIASYTFTVRATNLSGDTDSDPTVPLVPNRPNPPAAPTAEVIAADQARLNWTAPASGGQVTKYTVTAYPVSDPASGVTSTACTDVTALTCDFDGLSDTESYTFAVTAIGPGGEAEGEQSTPITTAGPGQPDAPSVELAGPNAVKVTWATPATGGPVTGYTVTSDPDLSAPARCTNVLVLSCVFDRLANGTAYTFQVIAHGTGDRSSVSDDSDSILPGPPGTPGRATVAMTASTSEVLVTWEAPVGGGEVTGYQVESTPGQFGCVSPPAANATSCVVPGLDPATGYTFRVRALGAAGGVDSVLSPASEAITPGAPGSPTDVDVAAGNREITVSWTAPVIQPQRVAHYRAVTSPGGFSCQTTTSAETDCLITGVQNLTSYTVTVTAVGAGGISSAASAPSARVRPTAGVPGSPTAVTVVGASGSATVSWTAPVSTGDGIARYTATASNSAGSRSCSTANGTTLTCPITGLTNGQQYSVTVMSIGRAATGNSAPSAAVMFTSLNPPGTPTNVLVAGGVKILAVEWTAGSSGDGLSGYTVTAAGGTTPLTCTAPAGTTTCSIANVTPGVYSVTVVANGNQTGIASAPSAAVESKVLLASAPTLPTSLPTSSGTLTVSAGTVQAGGTVTVTGTGFAPFTGIALGLYTGAVKVGTASTDANGGFVQDVTIPTSVTAGAKTLVAGGLPTTGTTLKYRTVALQVQAATTGQVAAAALRAREVYVLDRRTA